MKSLVIKLLDKNKRVLDEVELTEPVARKIHVKAGVKPRYEEIKFDEVHSLREALIYFVDIYGKAIIRDGGGITIRYL